MNKDKIHFWLSDNPIESADEDLLLFEKPANVLSKMILECETPFTIGINGKWGSGKTGLMNLIKTKIEDNKDSDDKLKLRTTWFNTWNFANEKEIWKLLMISLIEDLDKESLYELDKQQLILSVLNLGEIAATAFNTGGISLFRNRKAIIESTRNIIDARQFKEESILKDKIKSIKAFRHDFEKLIQKTLGDNGKYVIFIDDLDRVTPSKTIDLIEAVKTFLDCKKCIFVIGCDYAYLDACVENKYGISNFNSRDYIEKIVQVTFEVTNLNNQMLTVYLSKNLESLFDTKDDFNFVKNLFNVCVGRNPRKIKKYINLYSIVHNLNETGLDGCMLLKLIFFMHGWPAVYEHALNDFYAGTNTFKIYEKWARPKETFEEYHGIPTDIFYEDYENDYEPPNQIEEYEEYEQEINKIKEKVDEELIQLNTSSITKNAIKISNLKYFLKSPPFFPDNLDKLASCISLVQCIDFSTAEVMEKEALRIFPSIDEVFDLFDKVKDIIDGQEVKGEHLNKSSNVMLPTKEKKDDSSLSIRSISRNRGNIGKWFYLIIDFKRDDESILNLIESFKYDRYDSFWIISPWGFSKSIRNFVENNNNIYASSYSSLKDLFYELKENSS